MQTPEQRIKSLTIANYLLCAVVVLLIITHIQGQALHHTEGFYLGDDYISVRLDGNNALCAFGVPFRQTVSIERNSPPYPKPHDPRLTQEEYQKQVAAAYQSKTSVFSYRTTFKGPSFMSPFLRKIEGSDGYTFANSGGAPGRMVRDSSGAWTMDLGQPVPQVH